MQDMRTARERRARTLELFRAYTEAVDSMMRAFRKGQETPSRYQLLEIPSAIFHALQDAPVAAFSADGPTCAYGGLAAAARVSPFGREDYGQANSAVRLHRARGVAPERTMTRLGGVLENARHFSARNPFAPRC